jgi:hypothetical protein
MSDGILFDIKKGWGVLIGVPALLFFAYLFPLIPGLMDLPLCGAKHFLGCKCPGCGMTGAFVELCRLNLRGSIASHPLGIFVMAWLVYSFFREVLGLVLGRRPPTMLSQKCRDVVMYAFLAALIMQWVFHLIIDFFVI